MIFKVDGVNIQDLEEFDEKVVKIDAWYDRHGRQWRIELLNKDGFQVGDAIYVGNKEDKDSNVKYLKELYQL